MLHAWPSRRAPPRCPAPTCHPPTALDSLALPGAMGALGWVAGGCVMAFFFVVTLLSSHMLLRCYEVDGQTFPRWVPPATQPPCTRLAP